MRIYEEYLDNDERELAIEKAKEELNNARLEFMLEMVDRKHEINRMNAELKVLKEGGTYEDLDFLYEAAENEKNEEKQGIISSIITGITSIIQSIINTINGFFKKQKKNDDDENKTLKVPTAVADSANKLCSTYENMKNKITDMSTVDKVKSFGKVVAALGGTIVEVEVAKNKVTSYKEIKKKEADEEITTMQAILSMCNEKLTSIPNSVRGLFGKKNKNTNEKSENDGNKPENKPDKKEEKPGNKPDNNSSDNQNQNDNQDNKTNAGNTKPKKTNNNEKSEDDGSFVSLVSDPIHSLIDKIKSILKWFGVEVTPDDEKSENDGNKPENKPDKKEEKPGNKPDNNSSDNQNQNDNQDNKTNGETATETVDNYWDDIDDESYMFLTESGADDSTDYENMDFDSLIDMI